MPKWDAYLEDTDDSFERIKTSKPKQMQAQNKTVRKDNRRELRKHKTKQQEKWED